MHRCTDTDIVAFRAAAPQQQNYDRSDGVKSSNSTTAQAAEAALQTVKSWVTPGPSCRDGRIAFTGRENWRKRILPTCKHNRPGKVKPLALYHMVGGICDRFPNQLIEGLEPTGHLEGDAGVTDLAAILTIKLADPFNAWKPVGSLETPVRRVARLQEQVSQMKAQLIWSRIG
jgi:hypothetical protein